MGCFSWLFRSKKKQNRQEKKDRKTSAKRKKNESPREDVVLNIKKATGGVAFEVELKPAVAAPPPMRHKFVESLQSTEQRALQAEIRRAEERVKRVYAAKEATRKRMVFLEQKAEQERLFVERAKSSLAIDIPDEGTIQANLKSLKKRCKTARTRQRLKDVLTGRGGRVSPSSLVN